MAVDRLHLHGGTAGLMHLFGIDPEELVYLRNGREQSLLDGQPGKVVEGLLAG